MRRITGAVALVLACRSAAGAQPVQITPLVHASVQIESGNRVIQVDPWSAGDLSRAKPADLILITDDPIHHLDPKAIQRLRKPNAPVVVQGLPVEFRDGDWYPPLPPK
jgi:L-ascorbate metabolism protein UlaG (beta-lactamase superfamily)